MNKKLELDMAVPINQMDLKDIFKKRFIDKKGSQIFTFRGTTQHKNKYNKRELNLSDINILKNDNNRNEVIEKAMGYIVASYQYEQNALFYLIKDGKTYEVTCIINEQGLIKLKEEELDGNFLYRLSKDSILVEYSSKDTLNKIDEGNYEVTSSCNRFIFYNDNSSMSVRIYYEAQENMNMLLNNFVSVFQGVINCIAEGSEFYVDEISIKRIDEINATNKDYSNKKVISILIEEQVRKAPKNIAIVCDDVAITYEELNNKANYIGKLLLQKGVKSGDFVPVIMKKTVELFVTFLGIMKVGAAFVPIEYKWPYDRKKCVIEIIKPKIIMSTIKDEIYNTCHTYFVDYNKLENEVNLNINIELDDNIYAIFTSGSTGIPKAAINKHCGILNRFLYMNERYCIDENDVILMTSNHVFDAAVWQMFWPLINGNKVVVPKQKNMFDIIEIIQTIEKYKITITDFVPSVFNVLVKLVTKKERLRYKVSSLRQLLIGGEEMSSHYTNEFKKIFPNCGITNTYGPSEASIGTIFYELSDEEGVFIPIGRPIDNVKAFILNKYGKLMPVGAIGMLYLGGVCVGGGYINEPEKTNKVFRTITINQKEERVYETGDLAQIRADGNIEYYGRLDTQVKINGVRIELSEIEKVVSNVYNADSCVLVAEKNDVKNILAFVENDDLGNLNDKVEEMCKYLPNYMIPNSFIGISSIPHNTNGKIDKKALLENVRD